MDATRTSLTPDVDPELLRRRVQLIIIISLVALTFFAISDVFVTPEFAFQLWLLKLPLYVLYAWFLWLLRPPRPVDQTIFIGLLAVFIGAGSTALSGIVTGDATSTQMLCMTGMLLTALGVPWGGTAQALASLLAAVPMVTNAIVVDELGYPFVAALAGLTAAVVIADRLRRSYESERELRSELEDSERFLRKITDQLPALIAYVDTEQRYQFVNRAQAQWARRKRAELIGRRVADIANQEDYALLEPHLVAALAGERATFEIEVRSPDDELRALSAVLEPDIDDGLVRGIFCLLSDVTGRKHAEESARRQQAELAHVLRVSTMGEMTAALAHELNQPLAAIAAYAGTCAAYAEASPSLVPEVRTAANQVAEEALRAGEIIRRLQRLVRKVEPRWERIAAAELIAHAISLVRAEAENAGVRIEAHVADDLGDVRVDAIQIEQVLVNLLLNAVQATERNGAAEARVEIAASRAPEGGLRVRVHDTGAGVPTALRREIFEPYFTTRREGLGMGLAISRSIVESHSGKIWIADDDAEGATFVVEIPGDGVASHLPPSSH